MTAHLASDPTGCSFDEWNSSLNVKHHDNGVSRCIVSEEVSFQLYKKCLVLIWRKEKSSQTHTRAGVLLRGGTAAAVTELSFVVIVVVKILASTYPNPMSTAEIESTDQLHERSS